MVAKRACAPSLVIADGDTATTRSPRRNTRGGMPIGCDGARLDDIAALVARDG